MNLPRHNIIPASYLLLLNNGKVLLQRRCNTGFEDGNYGLISGHVEVGETFTQGLIREIHEEIGIILRPTDIELVHIMHRKAATSERVDAFFVVRTWQGEPKNMEPEKCDDVSWFSVGDLPKNMIEYNRFAFDKIQDGIFYSEYGW